MIAPLEGSVTSRGGEFVRVWAARHASGRRFPQRQHRDDRRQLCLSFVLSRGPARIWTNAPDRCRSNTSQTTSLSSPLFSKLNRRWKIAVSTPIYRRDDPDKLLAVLVLSVDVGEIVGDHLKVGCCRNRDPETGRATLAGSDRHFAMLVDGRDNGFGAWSSTIRCFATGVRTLPAERRTCQESTASSAFLWTNADR